MEPLEMLLRVHFLPVHCALSTSKQWWNERKSNCPNCFLGRATEGVRLAKGPLALRFVYLFPVSPPQHLTTC